MDAADAIARAKAIAAKLNASMGVVSTDEAPRKRGRWGDDGTAAAPEPVQKKKKKIYIPRDNPEINFMGLLIGPRGSTQKRLEENSGARIVIRGRGSEKEGEMPSTHPDDLDDLHVSIEGADEAIEKAAKEVEAILYNPQEAMRLKSQQLRNLAEMNGLGGGGGGGGGGSGGGHYGPPDGGSRPKPGLGYGGDSHYGPGEEETDEVKVPQNMVGLIIGKGGENIQRMQQTTGCSVQVAKDLAPGETMRTVSLRGTRDAMDECKKMIQEIVDSRLRERERYASGDRDRSSSGGGGGGGGSDHYARPDSREGGSSDGHHSQQAYGMIATLQVSVPNDKVGLVIGRGGQTIRMIQDKTGAHVQIPRETDAADPNVRIITVSAPNHEAADAAQAEIHAILDGRRQTGPGPMSAPPQALIMHVNNDKIGLIIGRAGANIKDIQARTGTRIQIPPEAEPGSNPPYRVVSITGPSDAAERARYEIEMMIMNDAGRQGGRGGYSNYQPSPAFTVPVGGHSAPHYGGYPGYPPHPYAYDPYYAAAYHQYPGYPPHGAYPHDYHQHPHAEGAAAAATHDQHGAAPAAPETPAAAPAAEGGEQVKQEGGHGEVEPNKQPQEQNGQEEGQQQAAAADGTDMTAYYDQFWQYAAYYGEDYARQAYGAWAPPVGTPVPPGIVLPSAAASNPAPASDDASAEQLKDEIKAEPATDRIEG